MRTAIVTLLTEIGCRSRGILKKSEHEPEKNYLEIATRVGEINNCGGGRQNAPRV